MGTLSMNRFTTFLGVRKGKEKKAAKERFFSVAGVKLYASSVKDWAFPSESGEGSVNTTVRKQKMELVKMVLVK